MKLSIVIFTAVILYVSAGPLSETPSVRGPSQGCKDKWTQTSAGLYLVTGPAKIQLASVAVIQILQLSYWFTSTTAQLQLNIDCVQVLANSLTYYMGLNYASFQITYIQQAISTSVTAMQVSVNAVMAVNPSQGQVMQTQLNVIKQNFTAVVSELQIVSLTTIYSLMTVVSDSTLSKLTVTVAAAAQLQNDCGVSYSQGNSQNNVPSMLMDVIIAVTASAKQVAAVAVNQAVSSICIVTQQAVASVTAVQVTAMQAAPTVAEVSMNATSTTIAVSYTTLVSTLFVQTEFDVQVVVSASADLEDGNSNCTSVIKQNITDTNTEFTQMCSDKSDADNITATVQNFTSQITVIMQTQSTLTVQMCANIAISGMIVEQTKGHNGIGQCVSDGKNKNDQDMQEIQQNFTASAQENQQNLTNCCNKYKDPNYTGMSAANTDTGADKTQKMQSCKNKHTDKDMKKAKGHADEKCKSHKKGGDNYEKVKKCKQDRKTETITAVTAIFAQFQVCITMGFSG